MKQLLNYLGLSPRAWILFIYYNFICSKVKRKKGRYLVPHRSVLFQLDRGATIILNGSLFFGEPQVRRSRIESRLWVAECAALQINGLCVINAGSYIRITPNSSLCIGNSFINENCRITCGDSIIIGDKCAIGRGVSIRSFDGHHIEDPDYSISKPIVIGNHVWVGQDASILKGVSVGEGSVIAANAVVTKSVENATCVGGNPARVIKTNVHWH